MTDKLTYRQEKFAQKVVETGNQSEAYRQAFGAENYSPEALHVQASRMANKPKVLLRVAELQEEAAYMATFTAAKAIQDLEEDRQLARQEGQSSAAISATVHKAKLAGVYIDKAQVEHKGMTVHISGPEADI